MMLRLYAGLLFCCATLACAQDPLRTLPNNYWVEFETPWTRVIHVRYPAGATVAQHDHPEVPTLFVYLSDSGPVRFEHGGGEEVDTTRPALKEGQMRLSPGQRETHRIVNLGTVQSDFLRAEFVSLPLGLKELDKRIAAPDAAFWQFPKPERVEFDDPHLRVTRLGVAAGQLTKLSGVPGVRTLWLAVGAPGATVRGKPVHAGEAWDGPLLEVQAGTERAELVRVDVK